MSDKYVDSFVMPIAKSNIAAYEKFAVKMARFGETTRGLTIRELHGRRD